MPPIDRIGPDAGSAAPSPREGEAIYLFALAEDCPALAAAWPDFSPFPPPVLHRAGRVAAVIGLVPRDEYCGGEAAARLAQNDWLSPRILRHAELLGHALRRAPIFPLPFGTLYSSVDRLDALMLAHRETLRDFLRSVAGHQEWGLTATVALATPAAIEAQARRDWADWERLPPGMRYLRQCRDRPVLIAAGRAAAAATVAALVERLRPPASAIRRLADPGPSGSGAELVARFALLVPADAARRLGQRVAELTEALPDREIAWSLSGPWPPFSFRPTLTDPPDANLS